MSNPVELCSLHGLVRGDNMELGRDSDTGGQVRFSWHLAQKFKGLFDNCQ